MCTRVEKRSHTPTTSAADSESERERGATRKLASFRARMLARQARKVQGSVFKYVSVQRTATSFPDWFLHGWCLDLEFTNDWKRFHPREQECILIICIFCSRGDDTLLIILYSSPVMKMLWELCEREEREKDSAAREREEICSSGERKRTRAWCRSSTKQPACQGQAELANVQGIRRCSGRQSRKWTCTSCMWRTCCPSTPMRRKIPLSLTSTTSFCCMVFFPLFLCACFFPPVVWLFSGCVFGRFSPESRIPM